MNRILDINPDDCTCLVEPGVTFYALYEEIQARGYKHLWVDVPDLGGGSVLGNTLDRGVGYTVYGDRKLRVKLRRCVFVCVRRADLTRLGVSLRHGGGAAHRRGDPHGHGRDAKQLELADLPVRIRADGRVSRTQHQRRHQCS